MTLFVKISDFSQIVLWRLHFPVERSAISFFYKPWVIFRHRKKIKNFRKNFLTFSAHRNWIYLKISKKRNFENFVFLFEDFPKKYSLFQKKSTYFLEKCFATYTRVPLGILKFFLIKWSNIYAFRGTFFFHRLKNVVFSKIQIRFGKFLIFWKADDLYFRLVTFLERSAGK